MNNSIKKGVVVAVILLFVSVSVIPTTGTTDVNKHTISTFHDGNTLYVGGNGTGNYSKIQDAIDNASDGDTVFVYNGKYYENLFVNKSVNLTGEDRYTTIIDGSESGSVVIIHAAWVNISGFSIQNGSGDLWEVTAGIEIHSNNNIIKDNKITLNKQIGIQFGNPVSNNSNSVFNNIISKNIISLNDWGGIALYYSSNNSILYNNITLNNFYGISLGHAYNNIITGNTISSTNDDGLVLGSSDGNIISNNSFLNDGLLVYDSYSNIVINNTVNEKTLVYLENESNRVIIDDAGQVILINCDNITVQNQELSNTNIGILLYRTNNCFISRNYISNNNFGIYCYYSGKINITGNNFSNNRYGLYLGFINNSNIAYNTIISNSHGIRLSLSFNNIIKFNNISYNSCGILLEDCINNSIMSNVISNNQIGIIIYFSYYHYSNNTITRNNFQNNKRHAFFDGISDFPPYNCEDTWELNYWNRPRLIPKLIFGKIMLNEPIFCTIPWVNIDWRPALKPYDIDGGDSISVERNVHCREGVGGYVK